MTKHDLCLEEYIAMLKERKTPLKVKLNFTEYKVSYYEELPNIKAKNISGDNAGGFIAVV